MEFRRFAQSDDPTDPGYDAGCPAGTYWSPEEQWCVEMSGPPEPGGGMGPEAPEGSFVDDSGTTHIPAAEPGFLDWLGKSGISLSSIISNTTQIAALYQLFKQGAPAATKEQKAQLGVPASMSQQTMLLLGAAALLAIVVVLKKK